MICIIKKIRSRKSREYFMEQIDWIHKELNLACESNDIDNIKMRLHELDSKLYLLSHDIKRKERKM